jgi:predicted HicB family RNase H-like nuclease
MESESMNDLINKVKSNNQQNQIQKVVPVLNKEIEEVQFSFYIEKELYKQLKLKALQNEISMKEFLHNAIRNSLD